MEPAHVVEPMGEGVRRQRTAGRTIHGQQQKTEAALRHAPIPRPVPADRNADRPEQAPNTLFGLIPLGSSTKTIPLRNIASVDTNTKFNLGSLVWGLIFLFVGFGMFDSNALVAIVCLLVAAANLANVMSASLVFHDPSGGANAITVSILEKDKLMKLAQEIQARVFTDADQLRHEESMHMAEKQYTAQTNSVLIQQQMLANQQAQLQTPDPMQSPAPTE